MKYYIIDTFAEELFKGNPAGVCLMEQKLSDGTMQKIAVDFNALRQINADVNFTLMQKSSLLSGGKNRCMSFCFFTLCSLTNRSIAKLMYKKIIKGLLMTLRHEIYY